MAKEKIPGQGDRKEEHPTHAERHEEGSTVYHNALQKAFAEIADYPQHLTEAERKALEAAADALRDFINEATHEPRRDEARRALRTINGWLVAE